MDNQTLLAVLGIALSVIFFFIGYRQTIGARKERARAANKEIIESLMKRLVLENIVLEREVLDRFIRGKARDHLVRPSDLLDPDDLLDALYARVFDNDYIGPEERRRIIEKLNTLNQQEKEVPQRLLVLERAERASGKRKDTSFGLAFASVVAGTTVAVTVSFLSDRFAPFSAPTDWIAVFVTFAAAGAIVTFLTTLRRAKEQQEDIEQKPSNLESALEQSLINLLNHKGWSAKQAGPSKPYDLSFGKDGQRYLVEIKSSLRRFPQKTLRRQLERLESAVKEERADGAFLVTMDELPTNLRESSRNSIRILTIRDFAASIEGENAVPQTNQRS